MTNFNARVAAFNLGLSFQRPYGARIRSFTQDVCTRLETGTLLIEDQAKLLLVDDPVLIAEVLNSWADAVDSTRLRLRNKLASYQIQEAFLDQRSWPNGQYRLLERVIDPYEFTGNPLLDNPSEASVVSVDAIKQAFPIYVDDGPPLRGADIEFVDELRRYGNPWVK